MSAQDWARLGEEVKDIVQSALETGDFQGLSDGLGRTLTEAIDQVERTVQDTVQRNVGAGGRRQERSWEQRSESSWEQQSDGSWRQQSWKQSGSRQEQWNDGSRQQQTWEQRSDGNWQQQTWEQQSDGSWQQYRERKRAWDDSTQLQTVCRGRYGRTAVTKGLGAIFTIVGAMITVPCGLGALGIGLISMLDFQFLDFFMLSYFGGYLAMTALGVGFMGKGLSLLGRAKRFRRYVDYLGLKEYCSIEELEHVAGKSHAFVVKDLKRMIQKSLFRQGHLDKQEKTLMVTRHAYELYLTSQMDLEQRQKAESEKAVQAAKAAAEKSAAEKAAAKKAAEKKPELSEEAQRVIREGEEFLTEIKRSNDAIPGEEVSAKISRLEVIIDKIFDHVEEHPELIGDLRKLMTYYLPTTVKLLNAYEEMDAQPVQGPNIQKSKKEIEDALDTIAQAFENLLDGFFADTAWDVSSDISVLETMLAQEGLTKEPFGRDKEKGE